MTNREDNDNLVSPVPGFNMSPVRPQNPNANREPVMPSVPRPARPEPQHHQDPTPTEEIDLGRSAQEKSAVALDRLRQKMAAVAEEYAQGKLNRAQFSAIYQRYKEQREITERLVQRDPKTGAWQSVVQPGLTGFLREHFEAKVESYSIYHVQTGRQLVRTGLVQIPHQQVVPILRKLQAVIQAQTELPGIARRRLNDEHFVVLVPGMQTLSVVICSLEPSVAQLELFEDLHRDFERANQNVLVSGNLDPREMVFPHRALFEK